MRASDGGLIRAGPTVCLIQKDLRGLIRPVRRNFNSPVLNFQVKIGHGLQIGRYLDTVTIKSRLTLRAGNMLMTLNLSL